MGGVQHCLTLSNYGQNTSSLDVELRPLFLPPDWSTGSARAAETLPRRAPQAVFGTASLATATLPRAATRLRSTAHRSSTQISSLDGVDAGVYGNARTQHLSLKRLAAATRGKSSPRTHCRNFARRRRARERRRATASALYDADACARAGALSSESDVRADSMHRGSASTGAGA